MITCGKGGSNTNNRVAAVIKKKTSATQEKVGPLSLGDEAETK